MRCNNCNVEISSAFSYSLMSNSCPACGKEIMNDEKSRMLAYIIQTMGGQGFSKKIESSILNEISLFIFSEFLDVEESDVEEMDDNDRSTRSLTEEDDSEDIAEDQQFDDISSSIYTAPQDEDLDDKAARLVEKYRADKKTLSSGAKTGVSVRRVSL